MQSTRDDSERLCFVDNLMFVHLLLGNRQPEVEVSIFFTLNVLWEVEVSIFFYFECVVGVHIFP